MQTRFRGTFAVLALLSGCGRAAVASEAPDFEDAGRAGTESPSTADDANGETPSSNTGADGGSSTGADGSGGNAQEAEGDASAGLAPDAATTPPAFHPWPEGMGPPEHIRLNHLQVIGTHNSYHKAPLIAADESHKYTHKPLNEQLEGGVRAFELDLHGGQDGKIHVYHIQAIDDRTTCSKLVDCLNVLKTWSDGRPTHTPIFVWFEIKNDTSITQAINDIREVEQEILSVIPAERLITADFIRGSYASPRARVEAEGWPALRDVAGMFAFMLIDRDDLASAYSANQTSLDGRKIWINAGSDQHTQPWALFTKVGGTDDAAEISDALEHQLIVASNSCGTGPSDEECQTRLDVGIKNGLHMLKDDHPFPTSGQSYVAKLPGGSPGCNPVTAPSDCNPSTFE